MPVVITNCTNRKRGIATKTLSASSLTKGAIADVATQWLDRLKVAPVQMAAKEIYCGRSFREAEKSAHPLKDPFYVVSAGLGVVESKRLIPIYDLTVTPGKKNSISKKVIGAVSPQEWWAKVSKRNPFGLPLLATLAKHPNDLILIALSSPYISLISDELLQITVAQSRHLRFFGKNLDKALPAHLVASWMPYDDRLDSVGPGFSGTQTDHAQRALRHFSKELLPTSRKDASAAIHRALVIAALANLVARVVPVRAKLTDEQIVKTIRKNWKRGRGQSSELLRLLRHDLGIACEQSRFRTLYHTVKDTMESAE